jgi:RNase P subunit RPR2
MVMVVSQPASKRTTCYQCKCVLEYQFSDMRFSLEKDYGGGCDRIARIQCPSCGVQITVNSVF